MTPSGGLDEGHRQRLAELLRRCTVQIQAGRTSGTGFVIAPKYVMTCRHVVDAAIAPRTATISVTGLFSGSDQPKSTPAAILEVPAGDWPDIAILSLTADTAGSCVILDASDIPDDAPLMSGGYPAKAHLAYQAQRFTAGFPAHGSGQVKELRIEGDLVIDGMSGSPVVSLRSGLVVGILRITKGGGTLGGFSTMFADVLDEIPLLQAFVDRPPSAARQWADTVGALCLRESGRAPKTGARWSQTSLLARIDLTVEQETGGALGSWQVSVKNTRATGAGGPVPRTAADLGEGVLRAVDGWSRQQPIKLPDEVMVLGKVLDRALIADEARAAVAEAVTMPPFLLRVCLENAGGLSQLPWEYACGDDAVPVSVNENLAFARFVAAPGKPPAPQDQLRVLAIVEFPQLPARDFREYLDESGHSIRPSRDEFDRCISEVFINPQRVHFESVVSQSGGDLQAKLEEGWDVVHYMGFAWATSGKIVLSMGSGRQSSFNPISIKDLGEDYLAPARCSVFVAEFHRLPLGSELGQPADPGAFTALLQGDLHAVVVTQHPTDLVDLSRFNRKFYERIAAGWTTSPPSSTNRAAPWTSRGWPVPSTPGPPRSRPTPGRRRRASRPNSAGWPATSTIRPRSANWPRSRPG
jgi:hypothetical protein